MARLRRSSLFGTTTHVPQGRVLTAEEEYGSVFGGVLDDEEDYVDDIDLDDEEEFGSFDEVEEEDDWEAMGAYGSDPDADASASIEELDAELDADLYAGTAWYGREGPLMVPAPAQDDVDALADALNIGAVMPSFLQSKGEKPGWTEWVFERSNNLISGNETREIAKYLMLEPGFAHWNSMGLEQQAAMVHAAIAKAAELGVELESDDVIRRSMQQGQSGFRSAASSLWTMGTRDLPRMIGAALTELGVPASDDQLINGTATRYLVIGRMYPDLYAWLANAVTKQGQAAIEGMQEATQDLGQIPVTAPGVVPPTPTVQPPPTALPTGSGFPTPAQILGVGTGVIVAGAMLGVFK